MAVGIGAAGIVGIALEAVAGTYVAPTKFMPVRSESLTLNLDTNFLREIKGVADVSGAVKGNSSVEGTIDVVVRHDSIVHWLYAARATVVKSGITPDFVYTFSPSSAAEAPNKTLSITIVRNGQVFAYTGCVVGSQEWSIDNGLLVCSFNVLGENENSQAAPTPTYSNVDPFGAGSYVLEIPTATQVFDVDTFSMSIDDSGEAQYRLRDDRFTPSFIKFGERSVTLSTTRDFHNRDQYNAYKALTDQSVTLRAQQSVARYVEFTLPNVKQDTYTVALGGQGDLIMAQSNFTAVHNGSPTYTIEVGTSENIT